LFNCLLSSRLLKLEISTTVLTSMYILRMSLIKSIYQLECLPVHSQEDFSAYLSE
jgi:hypothetical protein